MKEGKEGWKRRVREWGGRRDGGKERRRGEGDGVTKGLSERGKEGTERGSDEETEVTKRLSERGKEGMERGSDEVTE